MAKMIQVLLNAALYVYLLYLLYGSTVKEYDPWFAFVVAFVLVLSVVVTLMPGLHASKVSPGDYPFED